MTVDASGTLPVWQFCDKVIPMLAGYFDLTMSYWKELYVTNGYDGEL